MADIRISELPNLLQEDLDGVDRLAVADLSASETKQIKTVDLVEEVLVRILDDGTIPGSKIVTDSVTALQIAPNAVGVSELANSSVDTAALVNASVTGDKIATETIKAVNIAPNAIGSSELANGAVDTLALLDLAVTGAKIAADTITATNVAANAIGSSELADNAVDTAAIQNLAVTNAKLAGDIAAGKLAGGITYDKLSITTGQIPGDCLVNASVTGAKIATDTITAANIAPNSITGSELADGAVDTAALANLSVTGAKIATDTITATNVAPDAIGSSELADGAVDTAAIQNLSVTNAKLAGDITAGKLAGGITYDKLAITEGQLPGSLIAPETLNSVQISNLTGTKIDADSLPASAVSPAAFDRGLDKTSGLIGHTNAITAGSRSGITFDSQGHVTDHRALIASDLPPASQTALGGVVVPAAGGLAVSLDGSLSHANNVTASSRNGITYDANGHVVSTAPLAPEDLPLATDTTFGAVRVANLPLQVIAGDLSHADSGVGIGSWTKVTVDQAGHVTAGTELVADDVPDLDASKITTGEFGTERIGLNSITAYQLADYGIAHILQTRPKPLFAGQFWINPVDRSAYIWLGTVDGPDSVEQGYWLSLGYGSATDQNARLGGTYDAANNVVESVNQYGNSAGIVVGQPLPAPSQANNGIYLLATSPGIGTTPAPLESLSIGDWIFSLGTGPNWRKIGVISGQSGVIRDDDVLVEGANFNPSMPNVASQLDANTLLWAYAQVASPALRGTVKPSTEVLVDADGVMNVGNLDEGVF